MSDTHYSALGLSEDAPAEEVKAAWKRAAKESHPDAHPDDPTAADRFKVASAAYEVLSDADKRAAYDRQLQLERQPPAPEPPPPPPPPVTRCRDCRQPTEEAGRFRCSVCEANRQARARAVPRVFPGAVYGIDLGMLAPVGAGRVSVGGYGREQARLEARYGHLGYWTRSGVPRWKL